VRGGQALLLDEANMFSLILGYSSRGEGGGSNQQKKKDEEEGSYHSDDHSLFPSACVHQGQPSP